MGKRLRDFDYRGRIKGHNYKIIGYMQQNKLLQMEWKCEKCASIVWK